MRQTLVTIFSGDLELEGILLGPDDESKPYPAVVLCHPHPLFGGTMANPVMVSTGRALAAAGMGALLFNFRGVGGSQGEHAKGELEGQDVQSAIEFLQFWPKFDSKRIGLMGFSFGAAVALEHLPSTRGVKAMAFIAPSIPSVKRADLAEDPRRMLFIMGEQDKIAPAERVRELLGPSSPAREVLTVPGGDHTLRGAELAVAKTVADFFTRVLS